MKLITGIFASVVCLGGLVGCGTLDVHKERKDGNVVQIHSMQHVKSGRMINDSNTLAAGNVGQIATQLGAGSGTALAAGAAMIVIDNLIASQADDNDVYVSCTRPDDLVPQLLPGYPAKPRINQLGKMRIVPEMNLRVGDWVKVKQVGSQWTLLPCALPESGCQEKVN